jgi:hypothetical protein
MFILMSPDEDERNAHHVHQVGKQPAARFTKLALEVVPLLPFNVVSEERSQFRVGNASCHDWNVNPNINEI